MAYSDKPEETLAEKVGPWLDRAMDRIAAFQQETNPLRKATALASAVSNLHSAADRCLSEFIFLNKPVDAPKGA